MSIRHSLLALLQDQPMYGYQLRSEFEERTGSTWPLNIGQVYTTLDRLERDGLAANDGDDGEGHVMYRITEAGQAEVSKWFSAPVIASNPPRNELAIKLSLALTLDGLDIEAILQAQRTASMLNLQSYTRQRRAAAKAEAEQDHDVAWILVLDSLIFTAEAEIRWLDHCEGWLKKHQSSTARRKAAPTTAGSQDKNSQEVSR
ncbi:transcriptional regulator [Glutamicibacter uratoxydans]|uniref:Transcriptional regulator n=1 Tax=Glutamicibacter uratoxydans TaxID=43667 RepID=A0A4Y4DLL4_GLUUR|nr:PadR family transcriptional regulator [Glutamicibacter uratoxydans]GED05493.1 transcriptional regulator [Glutamicibacter uratoxydans]